MTDLPDPGLEIDLDIQEDRSYIASTWPELCPSCFRPWERVEPTVPRFSSEHFLEPVRHIVAPEPPFVLVPCGCPVRRFMIRVWDAWPLDPDRQA